MTNQPNSAPFAGTQTQPKQIFRDQLSKKDRRDVLKISVGASSSYQARLTGIQRGANVDLLLLHKGEIIAASTRSGKQPETIQIGSLEQGVYRLVAQLKGKVATRFKLKSTVTELAVPSPTPAPLPNPNPSPSPLPNPSPSPLPNPSPSPSPLPNPSPSPSPLPNPSPSPSPLPNPSPSPTPEPTPTPGPADFAGNSPGMARAVSLKASPTGFTDFVGTGDFKDFYSFTVGGSDPTGVLTGSLFGANGGALGGTVTVNLFRSDGTTLVTTQTLSGNGATLFSDKPLANGQYFLEVDTSAVSVNYDLALSATSIPDAAGGVSNPNVLAIQTSVEQTLSDFVGSGDAEDFYQFTAPIDRGVTLKLQRTGGGQLDTVDINLFGPDGNPVPFSDPSLDLGNTTLSIIRNLDAAGTYKLRVSDSGNSGIKYDLTYSLYGTSSPT